MGSIGVPPCSVLAPQVQTVFWALQVSTHFSYSPHPPLSSNTGRDLPLPLALPPQLCSGTLIRIGAAPNVPAALSHPKTAPGKSLAGQVFLLFYSQYECRLTWSFRCGLLDHISAYSSLKGDSSILKTPVSKSACSWKCPCLSHWSVAFPSGDVSFVHRQSRIWLLTSFFYLENEPKEGCRGQSTLSDCSPCNPNRKGFTILVEITEIISFPSIL